MKYRIAIWATAGFLVAGFWALYASAARPFTFADPIMNLVRITCPIALITFYPLKLYWVLLANAATYLLLGLAVETLRHRLRPAK
jgi:hypothetical protein